MKKHRISKRILAMMLVICMVFTMLPANVNAAVQGDIGDATMGLQEGSMDDDDTITWPIEIYDYHNDGMLFEYASMTGSGDVFGLRDEIGRYVYMPDMTTDYCSDFTTDTINDSFVVTNRFDNWFISNTEQDGYSTYVQTEESATNFKYFTFQPFGYTGTDLIDFRDKNSDGVDDGVGVVPKDDVHYAVVVYKTSDLETDGTLELFLRGENEIKYFGDYETVTASGDEATSDWTYCVLDFNNYTIEADTTIYKDWGLVEENIKSAGIRFYPDFQPVAQTGDKVDDDGSYQFMISHFALFSTAEAAQAYGEKALVNNKHYIYRDIENNFPDMTTEYGSDFTTDEMANSKVVTEWFDAWWISDTEGTTSSSGNATSLYEYTSDTVTDSDGNLYQVGSKYYKFHKFNGGGTELIDFSSKGNVQAGKLKFATLVYRVEGLSSTGTITPFVRGTGGIKEGEPIPTWNTGWWTITFPINSDYDISSAGILFTPATSEDDYDFMVSHFALFETKAEANAYGQKAIKFHTNYDAVSAWYNSYYSNYGYGLLEGSTNSSYTKITDRIGYNPSTGDLGYFGADGQIYYLVSGNSTDDMSTISFDGYQLLGTLKEGTLTAGLLEGSLGDDGNPVYREETITYLAETLADTLVIPGYLNGNFNYDCVRGEPSIAYGDETDAEGNIIESIDLATAIRRCVGIDLDRGVYEVNVGNIADTKEKVKDGLKLKGTWQECKKNIKTCYDVAYYLLNNIFVAGSYNQPQDAYDYLVLNKATTEDGRELFVFDAGYSKKVTGADGVAYDKSALVYDEDNKTISIKEATGKAIYYYDDIGGNTTLFPFLPVRDAEGNQEQTMSPHFADQGVGYDAPYGETYYGRNYNYAIKSSGEFVYHEDDGLFFNFEGDDDVYLFVNGQLVLDIGGAHGITKQNIDINKYVNAARDNIAAAKAKGQKPSARDLALAFEEGGIYSFNFFYMERHGYGANCRIATNMRITDPALRVEKKAYQEDIEINYGGVVDETNPIAYDFMLENTGNTKLYNISFNDPSIGVKIDSIEGLKVTGNNVMAADKSSLDANELTAVVTGYKKVDAGTGNYIRTASGEMVAQENGDYIYTVNEVDFEATTDDNGNTITANEALKHFMATLEDGEGGLESDDNGLSGEVSTGGGGLWINSTLTIKGIYYTLTNDQVDKGYFDNTVYVTAITMNEEVIRGQDNHRVYVPSAPYYYQWAEHDIIITKDKLVKDIIDNSREEGDPFFEKVNGLTKDNITSIKEATYTGHEIITSTVTIDASNNVKVNYAEVGTHVFYLNVYYAASAEPVLVPVVINTTDVENSYIVLDYGLSVELTKDNEVFKYDTTTVPGTETDTHIMGIADANIELSYKADADGIPGKHIVTFEADGDNEVKTTYGRFTLRELSNNEHEFSLFYKPEDFMGGKDSIYVAVAVHDHTENDFTPAGLGDEINISKEVQMYKEISVLPANVVYYEDDFPAVHYKDENGNDITKEPIFEHIGSSSDLTQSTNQDQEYGRDDAYGKNSNMSGNSITQITIQEAGQVAYFEFAGTGFEMIGRTNATDSATMVIEVFNEKGETVKYLPVITEFDHGANGGDEAIYQVPVIRVDDLEYGKYSVSVTGVPAVKFTEDGVEVIPTILYIDGFRIFQPLGATNENYIDSENGAAFEEVRDLIVNGQAAVVTYEENTDKLSVSTGTATWTEARNKEFEGNKVSSVNDYLALGPNSEVYMKSETGSKSALVFYVEEKAGVEGNLQIAFRAINEELFYGTGSAGTNAKISYGVYVDGTYYWTEAIETKTATEQYYTINYANCPKIGDKYQVAIKIDEGMVSYSSLKYNGLTITTMDGMTEGDVPSLIYKNGVLVEKSSGEPVDGDVLPEFDNLKFQFITNDIIGFDKIDDNEGKTEFNPIRYQVRENRDLRLIAHVDELTEYSNVSFTLTIDGKPTKDLVCTTAYSGLYATDSKGNSKLYYTKDVYGDEYDGDYFVTFTINNYLKVYKGKTVTITATYTYTNGETKTEERTVTIE